MDRAMAKLGPVFRKIRKSKGISIDAVSFISGVNTVSITRFENQRTNPRIDSIELIADAIGCDLILVDREAEPKESIEE